MKAYSMDLRRRILAACNRGEGTKFIADRFGVSTAWIRRLKQRLREDGELAPRSSGGDRRSKFDKAALKKLRTKVSAQPDITLEELGVWAKDKLGINCSLMATHRALKRIGLTFKKSL